MVGSTNPDQVIPNHFDQNWIEILPLSVLNRNEILELKQNK